MEPSALNATPLLRTTASDMSILSLVMRADIIVQIVLLLLVLASIWCWAIIFEKLFRMRVVERRSRGFEEAFWSGGSLEDLYLRIGDTPQDPMSAMFAAAMREWRHALDRGLASTGQMRANLQERIERVMELTQRREMGQLERRMTFLASVGSTAPFVGLFGTVWGIMNAFQSIAATSNTSLAVVAPGIAEALFATALGLFAAIPATAAYNKFANDLNKYGGRLDSFSGEFSAILSRYLEERSD